LQLARAFQWTPNQCDDIELDVFFDLLIVAHKEPKEKGEDKKVYIDQIF
jgi:hypothetical protein